VGNGRMVGGMGGIMGSPFLIARPSLSPYKEYIHFYAPPARNVWLPQGMMLYLRYKFRQ